MNTSSPFSLISPRSSAQWIAHFKCNRQRWLTRDWPEDEPLTPRERRAIASSVGTFQLGESSDGSWFTQVAGVYAERSGDRDYVEAQRLFIEEENGHSDALAHFMRGQNLPFKKFQWSDGVFRMIRHVAGLDMSISVLISAELIALVYYQALSDATGSPVLKGICKQILEDEDHHINFQTDTLAKLRKGHSLWRLAAAESLHRLFMQAVIMVVWLDHFPALKKGGVSFLRFHRSVRMELDQALYRVRRGVFLQSTRPPVRAVYDQPQMAT